MVLLQCLTAQACARSIERIEYDEFEQILLTMPADLKALITFFVVAAFSIPEIEVILEFENVVYKVSFFCCCVSCFSTENIHKSSG